MKGIVVLLMTAALVTATVPAWAQAPVQPTANLEMLAEVGLKMGESLQALTGYSFQRRTAIQVNGELKNTTLAQIAFGPDRQPLVTTLSSQPPEQLSGGPIRRHIEEDKINEFKGMVEQVMQLANSYLVLNRESLGQLGRIAQPWTSPDGSIVRVVATSFQQPGDQVTIVCDGRTKRQMETQVTTTIFGGPMTILAQYQQLPTGLNYNAQTVINVPGKGLQITLNTFNYMKQ